MKIKMRIIVKPIIETCGRERYFPDCQLSRALCKSKIIAGRREKPNILPRDVEAFINENIAVEYSGRQSATLDNLGAEQVDE